MGKCIYCGGNLIISKEDLKIDIRDETFTVSGIEHERCSKCGEIIFSDGASSRAFKIAAAEYRKQNNLLTCEEVRKIRTELLNMSAEDFDTAIGVRNGTIGMIENGMWIQTKEQDKIIRSTALHAGCSD